MPAAPNQICPECGLRERHKLISSPAPPPLAPCSRPRRLGRRRCRGHASACPRQALEVPCKREGPASGHQNHQPCRVRGCRRGVEPPVQLFAAGGAVPPEGAGGGGGGALRTRRRRAHRAPLWRQLLHGAWEGGGTAAYPAPVCCTAGRQPTHFACPVWAVALHRHGVPSCAWCGASLGALHPSQLACQSLLLLHPVQGYSERDGMLTMDLTEMNGVKVARDRKTVTVGGGARLGEVSPEPLPVACSFVEQRAAPRELRCPGPGGGCLPCTTQLGQLKRRRHRFAWEDCPAREVT